MALQLNYLLDHGGVRVAPDGTFNVEPARIREAVEALTRQIMTLQAQGDYARRHARWCATPAWSGPRCSGCWTS